MRKILLAFVLITMTFQLTSAKEPTIKYTTIMMDDGPSANTERLLKILDEKNVPITFDLIANNVAKEPEKARMIVDAGQLVFCHSLSHRAPDDLNDEELRAEIVQGKEIIESVINQPINWYWPPYLATTSRMEPFLKEAGMQLCQFSDVVHCEDYNTAVSGDQIRERIINGTKDGSLILLHDWRDESIDELPAIIDALRARGFVFLSYPQWYQYKYVIPFQP